MSKISSHYDNLGVARDATSDVIRAAYRALSQKSHPDRNPGNADASRLMSSLNESYRVLINPATRQAHDQWIATQEWARKQPARLASSPSPVPTPTAKRGAPRVMTYGLAVAVLAFLGWIFLAEDFDSPASDSTESARTQPAVGPSKTEPVLLGRNYTRTNTAPNGEPWPRSADYVKGYPVLETSGLSSVTVNNADNDSDVFVKLISLDGAEPFAVRQIYIPAHDSFKLTQLPLGSYDIRYRRLDSGRLSHTQQFYLSEARHIENAGPSNITIALHRTSEGDMQAEDLAEADF